jgi:hypothetical protein
MYVLKFDFLEFGVLRHTDEGGVSVYRIPEPGFLLTSE